MATYPLHVENIAMEASLMIGSIKSQISWSNSSRTDFPSSPPQQSETKAEDSLPWPHQTFYWIVIAAQSIHFH